MKNNVGVLRRPSAKPVEIKRPVVATGLLTILLIATYIFTFKTYAVANNILITGGILVYPFTFLIIAYISKYYGFKESRKSIFISAFLFLLFLVIMTICIIPEPNTYTTSHNGVIQYLFANDVAYFGNFRLFYPMLGQSLGLAIAYIASHLLYATIYNAINKYTINYLAMGLSAFIATIVDRIIYMPLLFLQSLYKGSNTFDYFIKCLTSEFIASIITILAMIILYTIMSAIVDRSHKKKEAK